VTLQTMELRPEARVGNELRNAREAQGLSLRALSRKLCRSHSTLVEFERGHRLAPLDVVEAYEACQPERHLAATGIGLHL